MTVLPAGYVWSPTLRRKFDRVYRELAALSE